MITVNVTEEQAKALDEIAKIKEFDAYFWAEKVEWLNNGDIYDGCKVARINGEHYTIGSETSGMKGMGGRKYRIKFNNGEVVETTNLWHQGDIPEQLKDILVDNAEFVIAD